ncbi:MAG TPA: cytochrome c biogenesis protein ResB [Candidatus Marinimicrobia bacterium]|nr:cytochrome c biogenesis protein ResB [Candidatus Neomarinimicrobiota bacterium]HRS52454.1 cytochrome c biogenesis protein ResB [Candidatus Neomarinimicrobiota bacterium]HRU92405.1 cytochrome c biogenesis protein ResB [Candidatus Neomarinimicrobiota bacterium]
MTASTLLTPETGFEISSNRPISQIVRTLGFDHLPHSWLNIGLWLVLIAGMLAAIFLKGMRDFAPKFLHFLLAAIFLLILCDKAFNQRFVISILEGQEVNFAQFLKKPKPEYNIRLQLLSFDIKTHPDGKTVESYTSRLLINQTDTTILAVNRPLAIGKYRLYQSAFKKDYLFEVICGGDTLISPFNVACNFNQQVIVLKGIDTLARALTVEIDHKEYQIPPGEVFNVAGRKIKINPLSPKYTTIIEVAEVTGLRLLALLSLMYLAVLTYVILWKQIR